MIKKRGRYDKDVLVHCESENEYYLRKLTLNLAVKFDKWRFLPTTSTEQSTLNDYNFSKKVKN